MWEDKLDLSPKAAQRSLVNMCRFLKSNDAKHLVYNNYVDCWTDDFQEWYKQKTGISNSMPLEPSVFEKEIYVFAT